MKFCDLRCTSHLRKILYCFFIRSNEDGCFGNQDHEKEKVFKIAHMIFVSHYMYCTVFWPCDKEPPPSSTQFMHRIWTTCWRTENHFMTLHFSGWHVSTFLERISGTPTALQHYKRAPHSQTRLQEFFHLEKRRVNEVGLSSNPILRFGFRDIRC